MEASVASTSRAPQRGLPLWVKAAVAGVIGLFIVLKTLGPIVDPDAYWHVAAGRFLSETHKFVISPDPWSATATKPWVLHQWLPELAMSWTEAHFGLAGIAWLESFAALVSMGAVYWACRGRASILIATIVSLLTFLAMAASISPRPQMVTFAMVAVTAHAWLRTAEDRAPRWWLIPLTWLWACSHGMWFLGPVIGLLVTVGAFLDGRTFRSCGRLLLIPLVSVSAAALTPVGPVLLTAPFAVARVTDYITEWRPTVATDPTALALLVLIAIPVVVGMRARRPSSWVPVLLLGSALILGLMQARTVGVAAAMVAPLAAQALDRVIPAPRERRTGTEVRLLAALGTVGLMLAAVLAPSIAGTPGRGPQGLNTALDAAPAGSVICNDMILGGWLIWRHPDKKVTLDGRVELYSTDFIQDYLKAVDGGPDWDRYVQRSKCTYALFEQQSGLIRVMLEHGWTEVATGDGYAFLRSPQP